MSFVPSSGGKKRRAESLQQENTSLPAFPYKTCFTNTYSVDRFLLGAGGPLLNWAAALVAGLWGRASENLYFREPLPAGLADATKQASLHAYRDQSRLPLCPLSDDTALRH